MSIQPVSMHNYSYRLLVIVLLYSPVYCQEQELEESSFFNSTIYEPETTRFISNQKSSIYYFGQLGVSEIRVNCNSYFCIAQKAIMLTAVKNQDRLPHNPIISFDYHLSECNSTGLELMCNESQFALGRQDGSHYYIFKSKDRKGEFAINFTPNKPGCLEKSFIITIS